MRPIAFEPWHWEAVKPREGDPVANRVMQVLQATDGHVRTIECPVRGPVAIVGLIVPYPGLGFAWARVSDDARGVGVGVTHAVKACLHEAGLRLALRQIRTEVRRDSDEYRRWIQLLGFEPESIKWGAAPDGGDLVEYVLCLTSSTAPTRPIQSRSTTNSSGGTTRPGSRTSPIAMTGT